jgi:hypothetical protein
LATATKKATRKEFLVETIDRNKLKNFLERITNEEGYELLSATGSSSIMGSFDIVAVREV